MKNDNVIILGDPHLGKSMSIGKAAIGSGLNSRLNDQINLLNWVTDQAEIHSVRNIIITGDVFEEPKPHPSLIVALLSWITKCKYENITLHFVMGNHDMFRTGNIYTSALDILYSSEIENVHVYNDPTTLYIDNFAYTLIPFRDRKSLNVASNIEAVSVIQRIVDYELASIPINYKKVVVGHLAIEGSIFVGDEVDDIQNELFCPIKMFTGYDYVWMGHVHKPQVLNKNNPYVAHIGSMDLSDFGEVDHKKRIVLIDHTNNSFSESFLPTRQLAKFNIIVPKNVKNTTDYVVNEINNAKNLDKSIVKIEVTFESNDLLPLNKKDVEKALYDKGVFNITNISQIKKANLIKKDDTVNMSIDINPISAIKLYAEKHVEEKYKSKFITTCSSILDRLLEKS